MLDVFGLDPSSYSWAIHIFIRLLGAIYVIAYVPFLFQIKGLIGKNGILPIEEYLQSIRLPWKKRLLYVPTVLWINASDKALLALMWTGIFLGVLLMFGVCPPLILLLLYIVHLSLTTAGQDFLSFGWETFLMEITLSTILLTATSPFNILGWINLNFLLFRFHIAAGFSKILSRDPNWRNLSALAYHYLTQPIPNTIAWFFHKLPLWFHKASTFFMFYIELIVPFAIFAPADFRLFAFVQLAGLQVFIWLTGNLSYLNYLTTFFCIILINNKYIEPFLGPAPVFETASPLFWQVIVSLLGIALLVIQILTFYYFFTHSYRLQPLMRIIQPFHIAYRHGIFAVMTTKRYEIIVEGSNDGKEWKEYEFPFKPGDISRRPRRVSPYQPRIDWQAWFLPFEYFAFKTWFQLFLIKILQGTPEVLRLLRINPFPEKPPKYIRALMYDYNYTTFAEKKKTGNWWKREYISEYAPSMRLKSEAEE